MGPCVSVCQWRDAVALRPSFSAFRCRRRNCKLLSRWVGNPFKLFSYECKHNHIFHMQFCKMCVLAKSWIQELSPTLNRQLSDHQLFSFFLFFLEFVYILSPLILHCCRSAERIWIFIRASCVDGGNVAGSLDSASPSQSNLSVQTGFFFFVLGKCNGLNTAIY